MPKKNVRYSSHAIQRKLERGISDDEITQTLNEPDYTLTSIEGRKVAVRKIGTKTIHVVYKEEETHINIITVY